MSFQTLFPINFSPSNLSDLDRCEFLFFRKYIQRLVGISKNADLEAGADFAKACEMVRKNYYVEGFSHEDAIESAKEYLIKAPTIKHPTKTNENLAYILEKYFLKFRLDGIDFVPVTLSNGDIAVEYKFEFDLGIPHPDIEDQNICLVGKFDMLGKKVIAGGDYVYGIIDEKTTGAISRLPGTKYVDIAKEEERVSLDGQMICYHWAARQLGIDSSKSFIRKIPILKTFEPPFELEINISEFMVKNWSTKVINKIYELREKYLFFKKNTIHPANVFYQAYGMACNDWHKHCEFSAGCYDDKYEAVLEKMFNQMVWDKDKEASIPLSEFKKTLKLRV
jgi:hypothetical protein